MSTADTVIQWDRSKLRRFKRAIAVASARGIDPFTWQGHDFVLGYAKYLAQYLEQVFAQKGGTMTRR